MRHGGRPMLLDGTATAERASRGVRGDGRSAADRRHGHRSRPLRPAEHRQRRRRTGAGRARGGRLGGGRGARACRSSGSAAASRRSTSSPAGPLVQDVRDHAGPGWSSGPGHDAPDPDRAGSASLRPEVLASGAEQRQHVPPPGRHGRATSRPGLGATAWADSPVGRARRGARAAGRSVRRRRPVPSRANGIQPAGVRALVVRVRRCRRRRCR